MFKRCFLMSIFCLTMAASTLSAAEAEIENSFELGEIIVIGEQSDVSDIGISQTISHKDIEATNSSTLADALKFVPGITMTRGRKNEPEISVHGFGQEKTLFLIDGIPYYETYYGKLNLDQISADIISKIEVSKNAPSVLYGANAQIAVINVITKKGSKKPSFSLTAQIGENSTYTTSLSHGNQVGAVNYWLSCLHEESDGWRLSNDFEPEEAKGVRRWMKKDGVHENGGFRVNSDYKKDRLWARVGVAPSVDSEYFVSFHMMDSESGHPFATHEYKVFTRKGDSPGFSTFSRFEDYSDWGIDLSGKQVVSDLITLRGKLFYHDHEDVYVSYDGPDLENAIAKSSYNDDFAGLSFFTDFSFAKWHNGHFSLHYKGDSHEGREDEYLPYNECESETGSLGTEHEFFTKFGLSMYAGIAYDWFKVNEAEDYEFDDDDNFIGQRELATSDTKDEINPMIGFTWEIDQTKLYGSIARKTRFPTLHQLYSSRSGNPELSAEN